MKTFKGYVKEELQFGSSTSEIIFSDIADVGDLQIPMSSTMFKRIFPDTIRTIVFHVTGADLLDDLKKLEGKKKVRIKIIAFLFSTLCHSKASQHRDFCFEAMYVGQTTGPGRIINSQKNRFAYQ